MDFFHTATGAEARLRVVFDDDEVSIDIIANATFGELAEYVRGVAKTHRGAPVTVAVTIPATSTPGTTSKGLSHGTH